MWKERIQYQTYLYRDTSADLKKKALNILLFMAKQQTLLCSPDPLLAAGSAPNILLTSLFLSLFPCSLVPSRPRRFRMWRHLSSLSGKFAYPIVMHQLCIILSPIALGSKPPLVTRIARTGLGTRLVPMVFLPSAKPAGSCREGYAGYPGRSSLPVPNH